MLAQIVSDPGGDTYVAPVLRGLAPPAPTYRRLPHRPAFAGDFRRALRDEVGR